MFNEEIGNVSSDPLDGRIVTFDFDELCRRIDGAAAGLDERDVADLASALKVVLSELSAPSPSADEIHRLRIIGARTVALNWLLNPSVSQAQLARELGLADRERISSPCRKLAARFNLVTRPSAVHRAGYHSPLR